MATDNLALETIPSDAFAAAHAANRNFVFIDEALGDLNSVEVAEEADGDPVDGDLADKLTAIEARLAALESAAAA